MVKLPNCPMTSSALMRVHLQLSYAKRNHKYEFSYNFLT